VEEESSRHRACLAGFGPRRMMAYMQGREDDQRIVWEGKQSRREDIHSLSEAAEDQAIASVSVQGSSIIP
jgi:hypothetical protein